MSEVVLLDTSVFLNVLDVPGRNQDRRQVLEEFQRRVMASNLFMLPLATIWETGNHIAHLADGRLRRRFAEVLRATVRQAFNGEAPFRPTFFPEPPEFLSWIEDFPDSAMRNKSENRTSEGTSLADHSLIKEWQRLCRQHPLSTVRIWSLDVDLKAYARGAG